MPFDLTNLNHSTRFYLDEDQTEWIELRLPSRADIKRIMDKAKIRRKVEYVPNPKTRQLERLEYMDGDHDRYVEVLVDYTITDWHLITADGQEIPCTTENKLLLHNESPNFKEAYDRFMDILREERARRQESETKNS
jgi:hypothetical protein